MVKRPGLDQITWAALREYIDVEVRLAMARRDLAERESWKHFPDPPNVIRERIESLQTQSTILETSFRELLPEGSPAAVQAVSDHMAEFPSVPYDEMRDALRQPPSTNSSGSGNG